MKAKQTTKGARPRYRSTFSYDGKRYEAASTKSQRDADAKAAVKRDRLERGETSVSGNMTVKRWAELWLDTYKRPVVGDGQIANYNTYIMGVAVSAIGNMRLRDVKDIHLQDILNRRAGNSKEDLTKLRYMLKAMFGRARKSRLIMYSPAEDLTLPACKAGTHRSITEAERRDILALAASHHAGLWIKMMLYCGLRPGETRALDWRHIDLKKGMVRVECAMKSKTAEIGPPKSEDGDRDIPIPPPLLDDLRQSSHVLGASPFSPVFAKPKSGKRHTEKSMGDMWRSFKRELDIRNGAKLYRNKIIISTVAADLVPYCLRHTYITDLQRAGVPINVARYLAGHADISTTSKIYTHITDDVIADAAEKIGRLAAMDG